MGLKYIGGHFLDETQFIHSIGGALKNFGADAIFACVQDANALTPFMMQVFTEFAFIKGAVQPPNQTTHTPDYAAFLSKCNEAVLQLISEKCIRNASSLVYWLKGATLIDLPLDNVLAGVDDDSWNATIQDPKGPEYLQNALKDESDDRYAIAISCFILKKASRENAAARTSFIVKAFGSVVAKTAANHQSKSQFLDLIKRTCKTLPELEQWVNTAEQSGLSYPDILEAMENNWDEILGNPTENMRNATNIEKLFSVRTRKNNYQIEISRSILAKATPQNIDNRLVVVQTMFGVVRDHIEFYSQVGAAIRNPKKTPQDYPGLFLLNQSIEQAKAENEDAVLVASFDKKKMTYERKRLFSAWIVAHQENRFVKYTLYAVLKFFQPLRVAKLETLNTFAKEFNAADVGNKNTLPSVLSARMADCVKHHKYPIDTKRQEHRMKIRAIGLIDQKIAQEKGVSYKLWAPFYSPQERKKYWTKTNASWDKLQTELSQQDGEFYKAFFKPGAGPS